MSFGEYRHDFSDLDAKIAAGKKYRTARRLHWIAATVVGVLFLLAVSRVEHIPL
jgi:hypothetical protein